MLAGLAPSPSGTESRRGDGQGLLLSRTMLSNHELPYVGRFACDWLRLATTDPGATHADSVRPLSRQRPAASLQLRCLGYLAAAGLGLAMSGTQLLGATPAHAAGDPTLNSLIIADPEPGWTNLSTTETNSMQNQIQTEFQRLQTADETFSTAVDGWQSPQGASSDSLVVFLVESVGASTSNMSPGSLVSGFCSGATNVNNVPTSPIPNVPSSAIATCSDTTESVTVGGATKGNLIELISSFGTSPLGESAVEQVVGDQLDALPASTSSGTKPSGATTSGSGGGSNTAIIIGGAGGGVVVVLGGVLAFVLLRKRRSQASPGGGLHAGPGASVDPVSAMGFGPPGVHPSPPVGVPPVGVQPVGTPLPQAEATPSHDPWGGSDPGWVSSLDAPPVTGHHPDASPSSAPGWYPEGGDSETMRYWDGTTFTARRRWNGSLWVDA